MFPYGQQPPPLQQQPAYSQPSQPLTQPQQQQQQVYAPYGSAQPDFGGQQQPQYAPQQPQMMLQQPSTTPAYSDTMALQQQQQQQQQQAQYSQQQQHYQASAVSQQQFSSYGATATASQQVGSGHQQQFNTPSPLQQVQMSTSSAYAASYQQSQPASGQPPISVPPGGALVTNQVYVQNSHHQQQAAVLNNNNSNFGQQASMQSSQYASAAQQQFSQQQQQPLSYSQQSDLQQNQPPQQIQLQQQPQLQQPQQQLALTYPQQEEKQSLGRSPSLTHLVCQHDGTVHVKEMLLPSGMTDATTGAVNVVDVEGIWARVRTTESGGHQLRLSLRLVNQQGISVTNFNIQFRPNSFGLLLDPSLNGVVASQLVCGVPHTINVTMFCAPTNQRVMPPHLDIAYLEMDIAYMLAGYQRQFQLATHVPLHIFLQDQPQTSATGVNPQRSAAVTQVDVKRLSCSDAGPRLTQSRFLELWPSTEYVRQSRNFPGFVSGVQWQRWFQQLQSVGVLDDLLTGGGFHQSAAPTTRQVIRVIEHKLSTNRLYVVASREAAVGGGTVPDLVFFLSLSVGEMDEGGKLVLGELRFHASSQWLLVDLTLRSTINERMWPAMERAFRAILSS